MSVGAYGIHLWMKLYVFRYRAPYICQGAAAVLACEVGAFTAASKPTPKVQKNGRPLTAPKSLSVTWPLGDYAHGRGRVDRYAKMASQTVARAAGYYAEYRVGMAGGACGFVYRTRRRRRPVLHNILLLQPDGRAVWRRPRTCVYCLLLHSRLARESYARGGSKVSLLPSPDIGLIMSRRRRLVASIVSVGWSLEVCYFANLANSSKFYYNRVGFPQTYLRSALLSGGMVVVEKMEMVGVDKLFYQACGGAGCYKHGDRPYHKHYSDTGSETQAFAEHAYSITRAVTGSSAPKL